MTIARESMIFAYSPSLSMYKNPIMLLRMKYILNIYLMLFLSVFLISCGSDNNQTSGLTPLPGSVNDPKDEKLFEAITNYVRLQNAPPNSAYDFVRVDLNGDGRREGIVLFKLPHTHWCGWDGCGMVIFRANDKSFTHLSSISGIRGPIYVNAAGQKGWRDIIIRTSGTKTRDKNIVLQFNGRGYPSSPMLAPSLHQPVSSLNVETFFR